MPVEPGVVLVDGPWTHREVTAGGLRTHVAEAGPPDGPLVLLLHGFPEFWWAWRSQLVALGQAGMRAVAVDLRGVGGTDKPPRGYDAPTLAADVSGLVRALGARDAALVGTGLGGALAWTVATLHPREVRRVAVVGAAHPLQRTFAPHLLWSQVPQVAEARLLRDDAAVVGALLRRWGGPGFPDAETEARCREAVQVPGAAHCVLEHFRWQVRSLSRPSGLAHRRRLRAGVAQPVLQLHGALDTCQPPAAARGSARWARGSYRFELLDGVGHFPHEEAPALVNRALLDFLS